MTRLISPHRSIDHHEAMILAIAARIRAGELHYRALTETKLSSAVQRLNMKSLVGMLGFTKHNSMIETLDKKMTPNSVYLSDMSLPFLFICFSLASCANMRCPRRIRCHFEPRFTPFSTLSSFSSSDSAPHTSNELDKCRILVGVITSCLGTIFACICDIAPEISPG